MSEPASMLAAIAAYAALSGFGSALPASLARVLGWASAQAPAPPQTIVAATLVLMTLPAALAAETLAVGWRASSLRQILAGASASMKTDVAFLALSHVQFTDVVGKVMSLGAAVAVGRWLRDMIGAPQGVELGLASLPLTAQVAIVFAAYTFLNYWAHRLYHWQAFWPLHRYHHAASEFSVINAVRAHPAGVLADFVVNLPMAALGASPLDLICVNGLAQGHSFIMHSRIDSDWGWFGRWVLMSPNHHRAHHKLDISRPVGNFSVAPIWDRLFGTWDGAAGPSLVIGVAEPYRHGLWIWPDIRRDFRDFAAGLTSRWPIRRGAAR